MTIGTSPRRKPYPLTRTYSLASLAAIVLVSAVLATFYRANAVASLQRLKTETNVALTQTFANSVWGHFGDFVANANRLSPEALPRHPTIAALREELLDKMRGLHVVKVKIYDRNGLTVFSTEARQIGEHQGNNEGFQRAIRGETVSEIVHRNQFNAFDRIIEERDLLSSYIPVRIGQEETPVAVFELYSDLTPLMTEISRAEYLVLGMVAALMLLLYLILLLFVRRADVIIRAHEEQERTLQQERVHYLAQYDQLTGLPNRSFAINLLEQAIKRGTQAGRSFALLLLDLDHFKLINDNLGHDAGNQVLLAVVSRLKQVLGERNTLVRTGGDEFAIILDDARPSQIDQTAKALINALSAPLEPGGLDVTVTVSMGITLYPDDSGDVESLLKNGEAAMRRAKELGRNRYAFFTEELNERAVERFELERGLRRALANQEFELHYQPRVDGRTAEVVGAEALLRWRRFDGALISPQLFIPLLEETGLIMPVGEWALRTACTQCRTWQDQGYPDMRVSVNLSMRQFESETLVAGVRGALLESGLAPASLELELTESVLAPDAGRITQQLMELKSIGVHLSIDDFGTGYSSLSYLMHFPIDYLKIDRAFVGDAPTNAQRANLTRAIAAMARSLNMKIVAEGVETVAHKEFLAELACDELQGFLFSRPLPAKEFLSCLHELSAKVA